MPAAFVRLFRSCDLTGHRQSEAKQLFSLREIHVVDDIDQNEGGFRLVWCAAMQIVIELFHPVPDFAVGKRNANGIVLPANGRAGSVSSPAASGKQSENYGAKSPFDAAENRLLWGEILRSGELELWIWRQRFRRHLRRW